MGKRYLIDTNVLIYFLKAALPESGFLFIKDVLNTSSIFSFVTQIELLGYPSISLQEEAGARLIIQSSSVILVNEAIIEETISIRKNYKIKLPDSIIAATAIVNDLSLITANQKDFSRIESLHLIDPFTVSF